MNLNEGVYEYKVVVNDNVWSSIKGTPLSDYPYFNSIIEVRTQ